MIFALAAFSAALAEVLEFGLVLRGSHVDLFVLTGDPVVSEHKGAQRGAGCGQGLERPLGRRAYVGVIGVHWVLEDKGVPKPLSPGLLELEFCPDNGGLAATADSHRDLLRLEVFADTANRLSGFALGRLVGLKRLAPERLEQNLPGSLL